MSQVKTSVQDAGLLLTIAAVKSQVSGLDHRCRQAENMVGLLMSEKIPKAILHEQVFQRLVEHMAGREMERSTQYKGIIQTTLLALNQTAQSCTDEATKARLVDMIKALTTTLEGTK